MSGTMIRERQKIRTFGLNDEIKTLVIAPLGQVEMLSPDFETVSGVSKSQGEKRGKALAALDHFEPVDRSNIPDRLRQVVYAAFNAQGA
jgi:hypothetical protein